MQKYLIDTCILIDFLKKKKEAFEFLTDEKYSCCISLLNITELYSGVRKDEEQMMEVFLEYFEILDLTKEISITAGYFFQKYSKSHGVGIIDALLAAISKEYAIPLVTRNVKHFPMLEDIVVPY